MNLAVRRLFVFYFFVGVGRFYYESMTQQAGA
jgi:hypothetical protein